MAAQPGFPAFSNTFQTPAMTAITMASTSSPRIAHILLIGVAAWISARTDLVPATVLIPQFVRKESRCQALRTSRGLMMLVVFISHNDYTRGEARQRTK